LAEKLGNVSEACKVMGYLETFRKRLKALEAKVQQEMSGSY